MEFKLKGKSWADVSEEDEEERIKQEQEQETKPSEPKRSTIVITPDKPIEKKTVKTRVISGSTVNETVVITDNISKTINPPSSSEITSPKKEASFSQQDVRAENGLDNSRERREKEDNFMDRRNDQIGRDRRGSYPENQRNNLYDRDYPGRTKNQDRYSEDRGRHDSYDRKSRFQEGERHRDRGNERGYESRRGGSFHDKERDRDHSNRREKSLDIENRYPENDRDRNFQDKRRFQDRGDQRSFHDENERGKRPDFEEREFGRRNQGNSSRRGMDRMERSSDRTFFKRSDSGQFSPTRSISPVKKLSISETPEKGIINSLKPNYGFISSLNHNEDIFFHFSALTKEFVSEIKIGLEVEFFIGTDPVSGKLNAVQLHSLPYGSVKFEETSKERYQGKVVELPQGSTEGKIKYEKDGEFFDIPISTDDISKFDYYTQFGLEIGDTVEFNIFSNFKKKTESPTNVSFINFGGKREQGIVCAVKEDYGFINCVEREASLYFRFNDILNPPKNIYKDMEVEFEFKIAKNKRSNKEETSAARIKELPKGTVSFQETLPDRFQGLVKKEFNKATKDFGYVEWTHDNIIEELSFIQSDVRKLKQELKKGDLVEFSVVIEKPQRTKHASDLVFLKAMEIKPEVGVICMIDGSRGFISSPDRAENVFFNPREFSLKRMEEGVEVEFIYSEVDKKVTSLKSISQRGLVKFEDISNEVKRGTIIKELKSDAIYTYGRRDISQDSGELVFKENDTETILHFGVRDLIDSEDSFWHGDEVEFKISTDRKTQLKSATNIRLLTPVQLPRHTGIICYLNVKKYYGFIRSLDFDHDLYFNFRELPNKDPKVEMEVEFSVVQDSWMKARTQAIRLKVLPRGSVNLRPISENAYRGEIREFNDNTGKIGYLREGKNEEISFSMNNFILPRYPLQKGEKVEFKIMNDQVAVQYVAVQVKPLREKGTVKTLKETYGFIATKDKENDVFFPFSEFRGDTKSLRKGDTVEFSLGSDQKDPNRGRPNARYVQKI